METLEEDLTNLMGLYWWVGNERGKGGLYMQGVLTGCYGIH